MCCEAVAGHQTLESAGVDSPLQYSVNRPLVRSLADARQESVVVTHHRIIMEDAKHAATPSPGCDVKCDAACACSSLLLTCLSSQAMQRIFRRCKPYLAMLHLHGEGLPYDGLRHDRLRRLRRRRDLNLEGLAS